jgi:prepilin-type N-terminal cleavage/methylation domain-containing protein
MSLSKSTKQVLGFTLIELLIVVAIIAILAAIAVPNFLEAQTRAKVARVQSDERSLATALESYAVDTKGYPLSDVGQGNETNPAYVPVHALPPPQGNGRAGQVAGVPYWMCFLTTPVSYITVLPYDPFSSPAKVPASAASAVKDHFKLYTGNTVGDDNTGAFAKRSNWALLSVGPSRAINLNNPPAIDYTPKYIKNLGTFGFVLSNDDYLWTNGTKNITVCLSYDPSNGTNSDGYVVKTGGVQIDRFNNLVTPVNPTGLPNPIDYYHFPPQGN